MEVGLPGNNMTLAVIQARMTSTRLPGKVLLPLPFPDGEPLIFNLINKLKLCSQIDQIVVVTSTGELQSPLIHFLNSKGITSIQGDELDVLSRFVSAIEQFNPTTVVRVTADNPFIDIQKLSQAILYHKAENLDYTRTEFLPYGMNIEVASASSILAINKRKDITLDEREHVTMKLLNCNEYKSHIIKSNEIDLSHIRVTVDTPHDYMRAALIHQLQINKPLDEDLNFITSTYNKYPHLFG
jgi:spore coat polysaccharide biosynthesis protein SpsF